MTVQELRATIELMIKPDAPLYVGVRADDGVLIMGELEGVYLVGSNSDKVVLAVKDMRSDVDGKPALRLFNGQLFHHP